MDLRLRTRQVGGATVVEVGGEVELHSAPQLRDELCRVCDAGNAHVVVDLSGVSFIDSSGLSALITGFKRARDKGGLSFVGAQPKVLRVLTIAGLTGPFPLYADTAAALAAHHQGKPSGGDSRE